MKKNILPISLLLFVFMFSIIAKTFAQGTASTSSQVTIGTVYYFIGTCLVQQCDAAGVTNADLDGDNISIPIGAKFKIVHISKDKNSYVIIFLNWEPSTKGYKSAIDLVNKNKEAAKKVPRKLMSNETTSLSPDEKIYRFNYFIDANGLVQQRYFLISSTNLSTYAIQKPAYFSPVGGAATLPFKYRPQSSGAFDKSLSITGLAGLKHTWRNPNWSHSFLLSIGIASIAMDSTNNSSKNSSADLSAISLSLGCVFQYKSLQLGIFVGEDQISNNKYYGWKYQGKPWFGIGIGFSIFSETQPASNKETQK